MNQVQAENFVRKIFFDIWEGHNLDQFDQYYHPNVITDLGGKSIDFSEIQLHAQTMKKTWINTKVIFKDIISNGHNKIAVRFIMSGVRDGEDVSFEMMGIYELLDNKLHRIFGLSNPPMVYPKT
jgi:hypothetical protein